jgi:hypothetical protein
MVCRFAFDNLGPWPGPTAPHRQGKPGSIRGVAGRLHQAQTSLNSRFLRDNRRSYISEADPPLGVGLGEIGSERPQGSTVPLTRRGSFLPWPPLLGHKLETARRRVGAREWRQRNTVAGAGSTAARFRQEDGGQEHTAFPSRPHLPVPHLPVVGSPQGSVWNRFRLVPLRPKTVRRSRGFNH